MVATTIKLQAVVTEAERAAVLRAGELLAEHLNSVAPNGGWSVDCSFVERPQNLDRETESVVIISLLLEIDRDEDWATTERRLRTEIAEVGEAGFSSAFVCTVLRHAGGEGETYEMLTARRHKIRRLNLLAAELSHELGLCVVDIDRDLADAGARALETDYRLLGPYAASAAGKSIAMSLLLIGLDGFVPFEAQEAARAALAAYQPPRGAPMRSRLRVTGGKAVATRAGRRNQVIESTLDTVDQNMVATYINHLLKGRLKPGDAIGIVTGVVRRHGVRASAGRLFGGLKKAVGDRIS